MEVVIVADEAAAGALIGDVIIDLVRQDPTTVLGLATGSSPLPVYNHVIAAVERGEITMGGVTAFTLDEYVGLPADHPEAYRSVIRRDFTDRAGISPSRLHSLVTSEGAVTEACRDYEQAIAAAGGISLQLLGIGSDGHIGFNEPISSLGSRTRMKTLTEQTRVDNARFFGDNIDQVPTHVVTQGIGTILESEHVVLIATGEAKARAVAKAVEGPVAAMVPASALQLHPHATVVVDEAAASELQLVDYYRRTFAGKPAWQSL